ncbi:DNA-directed RNA polymerase, phage-type, partial [Cynara cardunculus var. scolymus]
MRCYKDYTRTFSKARYESLIIDLSIAYEGYKFYLPVFLDFHGRIYRSGLLHFHERDLARSFIQFADSNNSPVCAPITALATCYHYNQSAAVNWCESFLIHTDTNSPISLINYASGAKHPFQFLSNIVLMELSKDNDSKMCIPITHDASASAYQIMSYFLMDECIARRTNLIPSEN